MYKVNIEKQLLYLISKVEKIEGKTLITIFEQMNYTQQTIRNVLTKLKKDQYITSPQRAFYQITSLGIETIQSFYFKRNYYTESWDKKWYIAIIEIPETERKKRDLFRRSILQLGFGPLYKSVYIYPWDITERLLSLIDTLEIENYVTLLSSNEFILNGVSVEGSSGIFRADTIWELDKIHELYEKKHNWFLHDFKHKVSSYNKGDQLHPLHVFIHYLELIEVIHELLIVDPMLPPDYLPGNWIGAKVLAEFQSCSNTLAKLIPPESFYYQFVKK